MKLLTETIKKALPKLGETDGTDAKVIVKFFDPCGSWTWYATEFDGEDTFFGLVKGFETELGYFSLSELQSVKGPLGIGIERDLYFKSVPLSEVK
jgi:hypothetical protein